MAYNSLTIQDVYGYVKPGRYTIGWVSLEQLPALFEVGKSLCASNYGLHAIRYGLNFLSPKVSYCRRQHVAIVWLIPLYNYSSYINN